MIIRKVKVTEYEYQAPINYVAGATEPDIQFQLTDYEIPSGATGRVYVGRSDGTFEYTVATISGNNVTVAPTSSMFSVKGPGAIQVTLYVGNEVVKNFAVPVYVHADLADDSAEAGSDVTGVFRAAEEEALADFQEQAEEIVEEVIESIPADYTELTEEVDELNERIDNLEPGLSDAAKEALLNCFQHVAWIDEHGQDYYDDLEDALYAGSATLVSMTAVFTPGQNVIYDITPLDELKAYLTVTGQYSDGTSKLVANYTLSGTLAEGTSTITVSKDNVTTTFNVTVEKYWTYEWSYSDGLPSDNGLTKTVVGNVTETMTSDGLRVVVENTSDKKVTYAYEGLSSTDEYTQSISELEFIVNAYGSYSYSPYGNGVRLYAALGNRGGNGLNCAELTFNTSGVMYLKTGTTNWTVLNSAPFELDTLYKVRVEQSVTQADIYVNDELVGTIQSTDMKEVVTKPQFLLNRGPDVIFKSYRLRVVV